MTKLELTSYLLFLTSAVMSFVCLYRAEKTQARTLALRDRMAKRRPTAEELLELAQAFRVWAKALGNAGHADYSQANLGTQAKRVEVLARSCFESSLSKVCSGRGTDMFPHVYRQIAAAYGDAAAEEAYEELVGLLRVDQAAQGIIATEVTGTYQLPVLT